VNADLNNIEWKIHPACFKVREFVDILVNRKFPFLKFRNRKKTINDPEPVIWQQQHTEFSGYQWLHLIMSSRLLVSCCRATTSASTLIEMLQSAIIMIHKMIMQFVFINDMLSFMFAKVLLDPNIIKIIDSGEQPTSPLPPPTPPPPSNPTASTS